MYKALDEKDLNQYRKYVKEKLAVLPSLLTPLSLQNFPASIRSSIPDGDLVALYTGVQGLAEAVYEALEQKIEELRHGLRILLTSHTRKAGAPEAVLRLPALQRINMQSP